MSNVKANDCSKKQDFIVALFSLLPRAQKTSKDIFIPRLQDKSKSLLW